MSELTGLELRKVACEALGWRKGNGFCCNVHPSKKIPGWHHPKCKCPDTQTSDCDCYSGNNADDCRYCQEDCAHFHANECQQQPPEITEPIFSEWCVKNGHEWRISSAKHRLGFSCTVWIGGISAIIADGSSPSEVRARAIVKAMQEKKS